jgi:SAM-dependent methyltransferase
LKGFRGKLMRYVAVIAALVMLSRPQSLAPYVPTPEDVVDRMLALADVDKSDVVIDLGCGDGRIPIRAAQKYGARGIGVDIDPQLIARSRANARAAGVEHLTEFRLEDARATDLTKVSVVTLYLFSAANLALRPRLQQQLPAGARVVSHAFSMGPDWPADRVETFTSARGDATTLYLWKIADR